MLDAERTSGRSRFRPCELFELTHRPKAIGNKLPSNDARMDGHGTYQAVDILAVADRSTDG